MENIKSNNPEGNTGRPNILPYDHSTFYGRLQYFLRVTDSRLLLKTDRQLNEAKELLQKYKQHDEPAGTTIDQLMKAKFICDSAFHPDTGEKQNIFGRMSCQVPGGMLVTGAMLTFYKSNSAVLFWQWLNQSFNALVNYTNRNANSSLTINQLGLAYISASTAAVVSALGLKAILFGRPSTLLQRFVPFAAVATANCVNIPLMRQLELMEGVALCDSNGNQVGTSQIAAAKGIGQVVFSRIVMAAPGMIAMPVMMQALENRKMLRNPRLNAIVQTLGVGFFLSFMVPGSCALFNQKCSISTSTIQRFEPETFKKLKMKFGDEEMPKYLHFNKGL